MYKITFCFIVFDFVSGIIKAIATKTLNSTTMRQGLFHKVGVILSIALGFLVDYSAKYFDIGLGVNVAYAICAYTILMETGSIIENIGTINPDLLPETLRKIFFKVGDGNNDKTGIYK